MSKQMLLRRGGGTLPLKLPEHVGAAGLHGADVVGLAERLRRVLPPAS